MAHDERKLLSGDHWPRWIRSDEGKRCAQGTATGIYLENRLWHAFIAGLAAGRKMRRDKRGEVRDGK